MCVLEGVQLKPTIVDYFFHPIPRGFSCSNSKAKLFFVILHTLLHHTRAKFFEGWFGIDQFSAEIVEHDLAARRKMRGELESIEYSVLVEIHANAFP